jgi:hypothetical protein
MRRNFLPYVALLAAFGLGACSDSSLEVQNPNSGETQRVLGTPDDAEKLLGSYYKRWNQGLYGGSNPAPPGTLEGMANIMSFQNYSSLNNECQNSRYPFSGAANGNAVGNNCAGDNRATFQIEEEVIRVSSNFLTNLASGDLKFTSAKRQARDQAFAEFLRGLSLGYLSIIYDSAAVVSAGQAGDDPGKLLGYKEVMDSAYAALQRAIDFTNASEAAVGDEGFPIPSTWIPTPAPLSAAEFVKLVRSYRAMFRAQIARTPAERAAANWDLIIADAQNGITSDHLITTSTTNGPGGGWRRIYDGGTTWHQMPPFIIGMGDVSGSYQAWLQQPVGDRGNGNVSFFMVTPDLRFPQGASRAAQQAEFAKTSCEIPGGQVNFSCRRYFTNRPTGSDQYTGNGWGWSNYDFNRFHWWATKGDAGSAYNGTIVYYPKTALDMLQAEGLIRKGQIAQAAALINVSRTKNGLPAITDFSANAPVPGGSDCVPKKPFGNGPGATLTCGDIMEAMKWEARMENAFVQFGNWFFNGRGWGDLAEGLPLFWAVPYEELQARGYSASQIYGAGPGAGNAPNSAAAKGTYGW